MGFLLDAGTPEMRFQMEQALRAEFDTPLVRLIEVELGNTCSSGQSEGVWLAVFPITYTFHTTAMSESVRRARMSRFI